MSCSRSRRRLCSSSRRSSSVISIFTPCSAPSRHSFRNTSACSRVLSSTRSWPVARGSPAVEAVQRRVRDGAAQHRVDLAIDLARREQPLEEPGRGAVGEALQLGDVERRLGSQLAEHAGMGEPGLARERLQRALQLALPAVRSRERLRVLGRRDRELRERAQPLTLGRSRLQLPRQLRERPSPRPAPHLLGVEERDDFVPEGARLARAALVGRRLADERQPADGARAGGVEEIAVALDRIRARQPCRGPRVEVAAGIVVEERRRVAAPRERALLEPEQEHGVEATCAHTREVENGHAAALAGRAHPHLGVLQRLAELVRGEVTAERTPAVELVEDARQRVVRTEVGPARLADRRRVDAVGAAQHSRGDRPHRFDGAGCAPERFERR